VSAVITLDPLDLALASSLVLVDIGLSMGLKLGLHRGFAIAAVRMTAQLAAVGFILRFIFHLGNPAATLGVVVVMALIAAREVAVRPKQRFQDFGSYTVALLSVTVPNPDCRVSASDCNPPEPMVRSALPCSARRHHPRECPQRGVITSGRCTGRS
jgi:ABC-type iron transport system FetAB permease component